MTPALESMKGLGKRRSQDRLKGAVSISSDKTAAICTIVYLLVMLAVVAWQLFDTWIGAHSLPVWLGYDRMRLDTPSFRLVAYTVIGGALGALVNGMRSFLIHYHKFAARHVWKYITTPWMGAILALLVYALLHSSIAVLGGAGETTISSTQVLANFAAGALAGYGSKDVFIWLDARVEKLFKVEEKTRDVRGQPESTAAATLQAANQAVGDIAEVPLASGVQPRTVVAQTPAPGESIPRGEEVNLAVTSSAPRENNGHS